MKVLWQHIDRVIIVLGLLAMMILGLRTLHNVALMAAEVAAPQELRRDFGDLIVAYSLNAGNNKPVFLDRDGDALVEYSAWSSFIIVDGITQDLWSHAFNVHVDKTTNRIFLTMSSGRGAPDRGGLEPKRYQIEQQVEVAGKTARVRYYFIPNQPVETVRLAIGHYGWYFERLRIDGALVSFERTDLKREGYERGEAARRHFAGRVRLGPTGKVEVLRNQYGTHAFTVTYTTRRPAPYERTLVAEEEVAI